MFWLGFVITDLIFLSILGESNTTEGCQDNYMSSIKVCKGDSKILIPNVNCPKHEIGILKKRLEETTSLGTKYTWKDVCTLDPKKYEKESNSSLFMVNDIGENDIGIYGYKIESGPLKQLVKRCCVSLEIDCEYLQVQSGSSVNLTCKVKDEIRPGTKWKYRENSTGLFRPFPRSGDGNIDTTLFPGMKLSGRTLSINQLKTSHTGTYLCTEETTVLTKKHYKFFLEVLIAPTVRAATSQRKETLQSSLQTMSVTTWMTRKKTPTSSAVDSTKQTTTKERLSNTTKVKLKKAQGTTLKTKETVRPTEKDTAKVHKVRGKENSPKSVSTRANCASYILVLSQLYIWHINII